MKVDAAVRDAFVVQERVAEALRLEVDRDISARKERTWHYVSRIKGLESFALKVETGRINSLDELDDVFAATIVVPEWSQVAAAEQLVLERYELDMKRPPMFAKTSKDPTSFVFDDLRLYVRYRRAEGERSEVPDGVLFEVQVKTFLQHAWAVATHDVVYKTPTRDWRRERIASQVRASLESAEIAIGNIENLATSPMLPGENHEIVELNATIEVLREHWSDDLLPRDLRRLAENIQILIKIVDSKWDADRIAILRTLLEAGRKRNAGSHSLDWSPYRSVLNYIATDYKSQLRHRVTKGRTAKRLLVYPEVLVTVGVGSAEAVKAVIASS